MTTPTFNVGDRVRLARDTEYGAKQGAEFTIVHISTGTKREGAYATGEGFPRGAWLTDLELVKPKYVAGGAAGFVRLSESDKKLLESVAQQSARSGYQETKDGTLTALGEQKRDRHIQHIADLDAVIRRRNATIERQNKLLTEYAKQLEDSTHTLDKTAYQLGLDSDQAVNALKVGARLLAHGFAAPDVDAAVKNFQSGEYRALRDLQKRIGEANAEKGFHEEGNWIRELAATKEADEALLRNYYTARLALITTEVAEAIEEIRHGRQVDETYYNYENDQGEDAPKLDPQGKPRKPEGVPSELADVVIRSFDFADEAGIDLAAMIDEKITYNQTRGFRHGKQF